MNWDSIITFFSRITVALAGVGMAILISQFLGSELRGQHALFILAYSLLSVPSQIGSASMVFLASRKSWTSLILTAYLLSIILGISGSLIAIKLNLITNYVWPLCISAVLGGMWSSNANLILGIGKTRIFNYISLIFPFSSLFISIIYIALYKSFSLEIFVYIFITSNVICLFTSFYFIIKEKTRLIWGGWKWEWTAVLKHGFYIQLANFGQILKYRLSYYFILFHLGSGSLGVFANALTLIEGLWMITRSIALVHLSQVAHKDDQTGHYKATIKGTRDSIIYTITAAGLSLLIPSSFLSAIFGQDFSSLKTYYIYLLPAALAMASSNVIAHYYSGTGKNHINSIGSLLGLGISTLLLFTLIPSYGIPGAAIAMGVSFGLIALFYFYLFFLQESRKI